MIGLLQAAATALLTLAVLAEVLWLCRRANDGESRRRVAMSFGTGLMMTLGAGLTGAVFGFVFRSIWPTVLGLSPIALRSFWSSHRLLAGVAAFVVWDAIGWAYHWVGHRTRIGWAAHRPHHTASRFDLTVALRQSWTPVHGLALYPLLAACGFEYRYAIICALGSNTWQFLEHASIDVPLPGWFASVVMTPQSHRHHHARSDDPSKLTNLGPVFTVWDRIAGTWTPATKPPPTSYGLDGPERWNPFALEFAGWRR